MTRILAAILFASVAAAGAVPRSDQADPAALEYQVKAAYLFNFTRFVEWPRDSANAPLTICVAGMNPFGTALADIVRGEQANGRPLQTRLVRQAAGCDVLFIPRGVPAQPYLDTVESRPVLTVGETPGFLDDGGIIEFVIEDGKVRFEIDQLSASRSKLLISSRLLRLARRVVSGSQEFTAP